MKSLIQSKINQIEARIQQYKDSELFSEVEKDKEINKLNEELEKLQIEFAKEIEVNNPEEQK
mgnify:CR=1 FL=1